MIKLFLLVLHKIQMLNSKSILLEKNLLQIVKTIVILFDFFSLNFFVCVRKYNNFHFIQNANQTWINKGKS